MLLTEPRCVKHVLRFGGRRSLSVWKVLTLCLCRLKLHGKHSGVGVVAGLSWAEGREWCRDEFVQVLRACQRLVELGGLRNFARTGVLQALAGSELCEPQSVKLATLLVEVGAGLNKVPPEDLRYYSVGGEDYSDFEVGTALQKATEANRQGVVKLLLAHGRNCGGLQ